MFEETLQPTASAHRPQSVVLGLTSGLDGLMDDGAGFEEVFDDGDRGLRAGQAEA